MVATWVYYLVFALLSPVLLLSGKATQLVRLPLITGYVLAGIVIGPHCVGLLNTEALQALVAVRLTQHLRHVPNVSPWLGYVMLVWHAHTPHVRRSTMGAWQSLRLQLELSCK